MANASDLTGQYIANTYGRLMQIDPTNPGAESSVGYVAVPSSDVPDFIIPPHTNKFTLKNGIGDIQSAVVIDDKSGLNNGGLYLKNSNDLPNEVWGIQAINRQGSYAGLNFWNPSLANIANGNLMLFLKNTGTTWIGYKDAANSITTDEGGYSLYVKDGIRVGQPNTGGGKIDIVGSNPLADNTGYFINGEHPFRIYRYQVNATYIDDTQRFLEDENGQKFSTLEWTALVVGQQIVDFDGTVNSQIGLGITLRPDPSGYWEAYLYASNGDSNSDIKLWVWDVMMIKKGFYQDRRLITLTPINLT